MLDSFLKDMAGVMIYREETVTFVPDMEISTEGESFADAIEMARDAIGLTGISMEDHNDKLSEPLDQDGAIEKVKQGCCKKR